LLAAASLPRGTGKSTRRKGRRGAHGAEVRLCRVCPGVLAATVPPVPQALAHACSCCPCLAHCLRALPGSAFAVSTRRGRARAPTCLAARGGPACQTTSPWPGCPRRPRACGRRSARPAAGCSP